MEGSLGMLAVILAIPTLAACGQDQRESPGGLDGLPRLAPEEVLRIGSREDPDTGFAQPHALDVDRDGRIYVLDGQDRRIRVYDPEGRLLRMIGGWGEGPGEFGSPPVFGVLGDTVWATEGMIGARFTLFDRTGRVLSTARAEAMKVPLHSETQWGLVIPRILLPDGTFLADPTGMGSGRDWGTPPDLYGPGDTIPVPRLLYDAATGAVVDTAGWILRPPPRRSERREVRVGSTTYGLPSPPPDEKLVEYLPDGLLMVERTRAATARDTTFRVTRTDMAGDTVFDRKFTYRPRGYDDAYLDEATWRTVRNRGGFVLVNRTPPMPDDSMAVFRALRSQLEFPDFQPPVRQVDVGADGRFWLARTDIPGDSVPWLVLDPDGSPVAVVSLPRDRPIMWSRGEIVWLLEEDELGVPWMVKYRLREGGG